MLFLRLISVLAILYLSATLVACESLTYYGQAMSGHVSLLNRQDSISSLLEDENLEPELRNKLSLVLEIRDFAEKELHLPVEEHYTRYADIERPYVIWNVFAAPEFSLQPSSWCYPVAGCVSYRGYFSESRAENFAENLAEDGFDVYVAGVSAYSTLGWFSDPLLSTFINQQDHQLAALLFHELAHQIVYIPGDTEFNESFATAVELEGFQRWLVSRTSQAEAHEILRAAELESERRQDFVALVNKTSEELSMLYRSGLDVLSMREGKQLIIDNMRSEHANLKQSWGVNAYDGWFNREINNAQLLTVGTYNKWVPAFKSMLTAVDGDIPAFYLSVQALANLDRVGRDAFLTDKLLQ